LFQPTELNGQYECAHIDFKGALTLRHRGAARRGAAWGTHTQAKSSGRMYSRQIKSLILIKYLLFHYSTFSFVFHNIYLVITQLVFSHYDIWSVFFYLVFNMTVFTSICFPSQIFTLTTFSHISDAVLNMWYLLFSNILIWEYTHYKWNSCKCSIIVSHSYVHKKTVFALKTVFREKIRKLCSLALFSDQTWCSDDCR